MTQQDRSLEEELQHYTFSFPILEKLGDYLKSSRVLNGRRIAWHCHLTALTAASARVLLQAGAELYMSECNAATTDHAAVSFMKNLGARVFLGTASPQETLKHKPELISDTGFVLSSEYLKDPSESYLRAACEITTSGITKMRLLKELPFPLININDGQLKTLIENYHGVGNGVIDALFRLTGRLWSGRTAAVVGYGRVGAGVAEYLRRSGALVQVVENEPIRRLLAHYDGFTLTELETALSGSELVITATGSKFVIGESQFSSCRDGIILMNVGHWSEEIDLAALERLSQNKRQVVKDLDEYELALDSPAPVPPAFTKKVYLAGGAGPANVVMLSGSVEPTLIHLTTEILSMHYLLFPGRNLSPGENAIPQEVERLASQIALQSLGLD